MKGVVFTEFLDMVADAYSPETADDLVEGNTLASGGAYTSVGTYDSRELAVMVATLSDRVETPVPTLLCAYGERLFARFLDLYPHLLASPEDAFVFLSGIEAVIHAEVRKLYPDAELPEFDVTWDGDDVLILDYRSPRCLADLADGLIRGALEHFASPATLRREDIDADGSAARFTLTRPHA
jgi:Haem-NO-binding